MIHFLRIPGSILRWPWLKEGSHPLCKVLSTNVLETTSRTLGTGPLRLRFFFKGQLVKDLSEGIYRSLGWRLGGLRAKNGAKNGRDPLDHILEYYCPCCWGGGKVHHFTRSPPKNNRSRLSCVEQTRICWHDRTIASTNFSVIFSLASLRV